LSKYKKLAPVSVAAFTGGESVPSARFRIRQYVERLLDLGVELTEFSAPLGMYPPSNKILRPFWGLATLATRFPGVLSSYNHDVTLLQREMLSTFITIEPLTKGPRVLDVDDAIWLHRGGKWAAKLAQQCDEIVCGNNFTAEQFSKWNSNVTVIPTGVDINRYVPGEPSKQTIIGWSGTSGGFKYLYEIESALAEVLSKVPYSVLRIVSDSMPNFKEIPSNRIEYIRWSPDNEVKAIQEMTIGIMPLENSLWERGKCSFKMLTYMACGIPVVVSPYGMNLDVLNHGCIGYGAKTIDNWVNHLLVLLLDADQRLEMGKNGRKIIVDNYSIDVITPKLAKTLKKIAKA
jgi:glycosyltransferase involved in cell wall biosynthesis